MAGYWRGWINAISGIDEIADRGGLTFFPRRRGCNRSSGKPSIQHSPIRVERSLKCVISASHRSQVRERPFEPLEFEGSFVSLDAMSCAPDKSMVARSHV